MKQMQQRKSGLGAGWILALMAVVSCGWEDVPGAPQRATPAVAAGADTAGRYIVVLKGKPREGAALREELSRRHARKVHNEYEFALNGFAADLSAEDLAALRRDRRVAFVEPDRAVGSDDTDTNAGWALGRIDQRDPPGDNVFHYTHSGQGVNIYIVDSGVDGAHPDFTGRVVPAYTSNPSYPANQDCNGHGTAVAGVAAGNEYGVAKLATIRAVRVIDPPWQVSACGDMHWWSAWADAVDWVAGNHIKPAVLNFSRSLDDIWADILPGSMNAAVNGAWESGVFVALSAGNGDTDACAYSPPNATRGFVVASMTSAEMRAPTSNFGPCVHMFAPGEGVLTAIAASQGGGYNLRSGTSYAAPFVAGAAAALLQRFPNDSPDQIAASILDGHGRPVLDGGSGDGNYQLYSVLPVPVYVQQVVGPSSVRAGALCQWSAFVRGGRGPFTYSWWGLISGSGQTVTSSDGQITSSTDLNVGVTDALGGYGAQGLWVNVVPNDPPMEQCEP